MTYRQFLFTEFTRTPLEHVLRFRYEAIEPVSYIYFVTENVSESKSKQVFIFTQKFIVQFSFLANKKRGINDFRYGRRSTVKLVTATFVEITLIIHFHFAFFFCYFSILFDVVIVWRLFMTVAVF